MKRYYWTKKRQKRFHALVVAGALRKITKAEHLELESLQRLREKCFPPSPAELKARRSFNRRFNRAIKMLEAKFS